MACCFSARTIVFLLFDGWLYVFAPHFTSSLIALIIALWEIRVNDIFLTFIITSKLLIGLVHLYVLLNSSRDDG